MPEQEPKETPKQEKKVNTDNVKFATKEQIGMLNALGYKGRKPANTLTEEEAEKYIQMGVAMKKGVKKGKR